MTHVTPVNDNQRKDLASRLIMLGVSRTKAIEIVNRFISEQIEQQIMWLPYRSAKTPASLLIAAIENDYEAPALWEAQQSSKS